MNITDYRRYSELDAAIKRLEAEKKVLADKLALTLSGTIKNEYGSFIPTSRENWVYSHSLTAYEAKVKAEIAEKKDRARLLGKATLSSVTKSIRYTPVKGIK